MMKKIVAGLFFLALFMVAAALIAPGFIDWSAHKEKIIAQLQPYLSRKIDVGGKVSFRILPNPELVLENVSIANAEGAKSPQFMTLKQLEARVKLGPLLQGRYEIENINLDTPVLNFETLSDGTGNWSGIFSQDAGLNTHADSVRLAQLSMNNGTIHYFDPATGTEGQVENLNLATTADTLAGPYKLKGDMVWHATSVAIEGGTGKYEYGNPVAVNLSLKPGGNLPEINYNGVADLAQGIALQGELNINGSLGGVLADEFFNNIDFLADPADITGMLGLKAGEASLTDIKGKIGKKGDIKGNILVAFPQGRKPEVTADLDASELKVTGKPGVLDVPQSFTPHLKLKGRGITLGGAYVPGLTASIDGTDNDWAVKEARIELPGKSRVKIAGVMTPKTQYSAYSIQVTTEDAQKMLGGSAFGEGNIFKVIGASGLVKKLDLSASLDVKPDSISLFDINGKINDGTAVSGVLNTRRNTKMPDFDAILNIGKADATAFFTDEYAPLVGKLVAAKADITLNVKDFSKGDVMAADLGFKGKIDDGVLHIDTMTGLLGNTGSFSLKGAVVSLNPLTGMDIDYTLKLAQLGALSSFGIEIPPPLWGSASADIAGHVKGDAKQYAFTAAGPDVALSGTATAGNQGTYSYQNDIALKNATWAQIGLPVDKLFSENDGFPFKAKLSGTRSTYQFDDIDAGDITGTLGRSAGKYVGDLTAPEVNFDRWLWDGWKLDGPLALTLHAKKLTWRSSEIANAQLSLDAAPDEVKVSDLKGELWNGSVAGDSAAHRQDGKWQGTLKASVRNADLQQLSDLLEIKGFTLGTGDIDIDVAEDSAQQDKNWFTGIDGDLNIRATRLVVQNFSPHAAARFVTDAKGTVPTDLASAFTEALRAEETTYRNVEAALKLGAGKITISKLRLQDLDAATTVSGFFDLQPESFRVDADVQLKNIHGFPSFSVTRIGAMSNAPPFTINSKQVGNWFVTNATPEPAVIAPANAAVEPTHIEDNNVPPIVEEAPVQPPIALQPAGPQLPPADEFNRPPADNGDSTGALINSTPIETEDLAAPLPQVEAPPSDPATTQNDDGMKGVLDRLNAQPPEPEQPDGLREEQKPDMPQPTAPAEDKKEILE